MLKHRLFNTENDDKAWMLGVPYIQANPCGAACSFSWQCLKLEMHRFRPSTRDMNSELQLRLNVDKLVQHNIPKSKLFLSCAVVVAAAVAVGRVLFSKSSGFEKSGEAFLPNDHRRFGWPNPKPWELLICSIRKDGRTRSRTQRNLLLLHRWDGWSQNHVVNCGNLT
jgi:hypothetical protein